MASGHPGHDHPAVHGMLIVGESSMFLSHLPMFHAPHDYQILLEVALREGQDDPFESYVQDRRSSGERVYTWVPRPFVLPRLADPAGEPLIMTGTIFRGHFERGGVPISSDRVQAEVTRLLFFRRFEPGSARPPQLQYLLFGRPDEQFVAHLVTGPPDYDHILSAEATNLPGEWDGSALPLEMPGREDGFEARLVEGEEIEAFPLSPVAPDPVRLRVGREFYVETGDLAH